MRTCHPCRWSRRAAFTLVEALVSIAVAAIAGSVLLLGTSSALQTTNEAMQQTIAIGMAEQLIDEILGARYHDPGTTPYQTSLGASAWEKSGPGRQRYNDIDDYHGLRVQPPQDPWGIALGKDDGEGAQRHPAFQAPAGFLDNWRQEVDVYYVSSANVNTRLSAGQTSDFRAVVVRIVYDHPERGRRELAKLRRIVAYVPPLP